MLTIQLLLIITPFLVTRESRTYSHPTNPIIRHRMRDNNNQPVWLANVDEQGINVPIKHTQALR